MVIENELKKRDMEVVKAHIKETSNIYFMADNYLKQPRDAEKMKAEKHPAERQRR